MTVSKELLALETVLDEAMKQMFYKRMRDFFAYEAPPDISAIYARWMQEVEKLRQEEEL
jgi:hypothetical protein